METIILIMWMRVLFYVYNRKCKFDCIFSNILNVFHTKCETYTQMCILTRICVYYEFARIFYYIFKIYKNYVYFDNSRISSKLKYNEDAIV